jgi:hypothetical protein
MLQASLILWDLVVNRLYWTLHPIWEDLLMCMTDSRVCGCVLPGWLAAWNQSSTSHSVWCRVCTQEQTVESWSGWLSQGLFVLVLIWICGIVFNFPLSSKLHNLLPQFHLFACTCLIFFSVLCIWGWCPVCHTTWVMVARNYSLLMKCTWVGVAPKFCARQITLPNNFRVIFPGNRWPLKQVLTKVAQKIWVVLTTAYCYTVYGFGWADSATTVTSVCGLEGAANVASSWSCVQWH